MSEPRPASIRIGHGTRDTERLLLGDLDRILAPSGPPADAAPARGVTMRAEPEERAWASPLESVGLENVVELGIDVAEPVDSS